MAAPQILPINADGAWLTTALADLRAGHCVAIPTETVYGLAADATNGEAVARIFEMKGRPSFNPLISHVGSLAMAQAHGRFDAASLKLAQTFWPGPLTLVVPRLPGSAVSELATAGLETIGIRMPGGPSRALIAAFGRPVAAPSANRSGRISPTSAAHVAEEFPGQALLVVDGGPCEVGLESTIVRCDADRIVLLRPGAITAQALTEATGLPVVSAMAGTIEAPGMMASHYAPDASLRLNVNNCPHGAAMLAFGSGAGKNRDDALIVENLSEGSDLREAAANLYGALKRLDAEKPALICVEPVPFEGIGVAINDRLARAAAPRS